MRKATLIRRTAIPAALLIASISHATAQDNSGAVQAWQTTGDQTKLPARSPDVHFGGGKPAPSVIEIDPATRFQEIQGFRRLDHRRLGLSHPAAHASGAARKSAARTVRS